jgi:Flp pilus assembly protein TadG
MKRSLLVDAVRRLQTQSRKGVFLILGVLGMIAILAFVGLSVDLGYITVTKTQMQGTADAAALAAAQEIAVGIKQAGVDGITDLAGIQAAAATAAKIMAKSIVDANGLYIDPATDVELGNRLLAEDGISYVETWGSIPYNMVKVTIRKDNADATKPDARLPLFFPGFQGKTPQKRSQNLETTATAFIESRDIVTVLDYSGSMAFDSLYRSSTVSRMGANAISDNLDDMWDALSDSEVEFSNAAGTLKFPAAGFGQINSNYGTYNSGSNTDTVFDALQLGGTGGTTTYFYDSWTWTTGYGDGAHYYNIVSGFRWEKYLSGPYSSGVWKIKSDFTDGWSNPSESSAPGYHAPITTGGGYVAFPQESKGSDGLLKGKMSQTESRNQWKDYISYVMSDSEINRGGLRKRYGYRSLVHYLVADRASNSLSEDLWRAPIYPHYAMKQGVTKLATFLDNLGYGDHMGLVTYATTSRIETGLWDDGADEVVDLGDKHLTEDVMAIDTIQRHKQPAHYNPSTGIGYGVADAVELLEAQSRYGAQKAILLMTDGQSNQYPSGFDTDSLPGDWNWNEITDFDGDGTADVVIDNGYSSGGNGDGNWKAALHSFYEAKKARDAGYIVHTISMGDGADTTLMGAIAQMSGGEYVHIASGTSNEEMEAALETAFAILAGQVPPARLVVE